MGKGREKEKIIFKKYKSNELKTISEILSVYDEIDLGKKIKN